VREMLARQFVSPVRFVEALTAAAAETDLFIEVGPGSVLSHLASACTSIPAVATDAGSRSLRGLLCALGAAFAAGVDIDAARIFEGRHIRPLTDRRPTFYTSLCESALLPEAVTAAAVPAAGHIAAALDGDPGSDASALDHVVRLVAARTELPRESVHPYHRMLSDLHLNSITVTQIVAEAARALDAPPLRSPSEFANARVSEIAAALEIARTVSETGPAQAAWATPGVDGWVRAYQLRDVKAAPAPPPRARSLRPAP
jgi:enediyne polyketide synthase